MTRAIRKAGPAMDPVQAVLDQIRGRGRRITPARRVIVQALLADQGRHLSAEEVVEGVRSSLPDTAESTVYRTLAALEELGVISHVHLGHGPATYHVSRVPHRHLVCTGCDSVTDLPADIFDSLAKTVQERYGFSLAAEHFALSGQCHICRSRGT